MKLYHLLLLTSLLSAQFATSEEWVMNESETWIKKGWFSTTNYLEEAIECEKDKDYSDAADNYEMVYRLAKNPVNKAHALFKKAECQQKDGKRYTAYKTYKDLIHRYPSQKFFAKALDNLFSIGKSYQIQIGSMFSNSQTKAMEVYNTIIETAPYYKNAADVLLRLAKLQENSFESDKGITTYERVIKKYKNYPEQNSAAYLELAHVYDRMADRTDNDCSLTTEAIYLVDTFLKKFPGHKRTEEAKKLKAKLYNRMGMYYYNLGRFYTWKANYSRKASRRYLHKVLLEFPDTEAAEKAEKLLASIDPDSKAVVEEGKIVTTATKRESRQQRKMRPFTKSQQPQNWEKTETLPAEQQNTDKWLLPVPNIQGDEK